jgi:hypothetical protein
VGGTAVRVIAGVAGAVGWGGLLTQLWLILQTQDLGPGLWLFVGYFTILTNLLAANVAASIALGRDRWLSSARARLMAATSILMVGLIYSIPLRHIWNPTGL